MNKNINIDVIKKSIETTLGFSLLENKSFSEQGIESQQLVQIANSLSMLVPHRDLLQLVWSSGNLRDLHQNIMNPSKIHDQQKQTATDDTEIAIVGIGLDLPGGIESPEGLWGGLLNKGSFVSEITDADWAQEHWYDPNLREKGKMICNQSGFLKGKKTFDASFFGISNAEAKQMDPQQRIALQAAYHALEDANLAPKTMPEKNIGVFMGAMWQDYGALHQPHPQTITSHSAVGWDSSIISARIAYFLGLQGPALTINTACSSSLVATHIAVKSLINKECTMALAGGVNLIFNPNSSVAMSQFGGLSPTGQCWAFSEKADGYVRSEGCGVVVLMPLKTAISSGQRIYSVIKGSAINSDGASNGITAPNPQAQENVYRLAWSQTEIKPEQVDFIETHGTGTPLGDPIEAKSLAQVFCPPSRSTPLSIGAVKSNFGHLEAASGILGLIKTSLSLYHGVLPPSLHTESPSKKIDFAKLKLNLVSDSKNIGSKAIRYAGVSSFGFGGTNAHMALAGYKKFTSQEQKKTAESSHWCFSGHGSQYPQMGLKESLCDSVFREKFQQMSQLIKKYTGFSPVHHIADKNPSWLKDTAKIQPFIFCWQISLAETLLQKGHRPKVVFGQSIGEVAAAVVAKALTEEEGAWLISRWANIISKNASGTGTLSIAPIGKKKFLKTAIKLAKNVVISGELSEHCLSFSGPEEDLKDLQSKLNKHHISTKNVQIDYPCHNPILLHLKQEFLNEFSSLRSQSPQIPFWSTTRNKFITEELDAAYWLENMIGPMQLKAAIDQLKKSATHFIEIAPHPICKVNIQETDPSLQVYSTSHRDRKEYDFLGNLPFPAPSELQKLSLPSEDHALARDSFVITAQNPVSLHKKAFELAEWIQKNANSIQTNQLSSGLMRQKDLWKHRAVFNKSSLSDLQEKLQLFHATKGQKGADEKNQGKKASRLVALFSGQGSQFIGMGAELYHSSAAFREEWDGIDLLFAKYGLEKLSTLVFTKNNRNQAKLNATQLTQPAIFALSASLYRFWQDLGLAPDYLIGHSIGEISAAYISGMVSREDAVKLVFHRSKLMSSCPGKGGMMAVFADSPTIQEILPKSLSFAAYNAPHQQTLSGALAELSAFALILQSKGIKYKKLAVSHAFHSPFLLPIRDQFLEILKEIKWQKPQIPLISSVTGEITTTPFANEYWAEQILLPVDFHSAMQALPKNEDFQFVEIGPQNHLGQFAKAQLHLEAEASQSLKKNESGLLSIKKAINQLVARGVELKLDKIWAPTASPLPLPGYPFDRKEYWSQALKQTSKNPQTVFEESWQTLEFSESFASQNKLYVLGEHVQTFQSKAAKIKNARIGFYESLAKLKEAALSEATSNQQDRIQILLLGDSSLAPYEHAKKDFCLLQSLAKLPFKPNIWVYDDGSLSMGHRMGFWKAFYAENRCSAGGVICGSFADHAKDNFKHLFLPPLQMQTGVYKWSAGRFWQQKYKISALDSASSKNEQVQHTAIISGAGGGLGTELVRSLIQKKAFKNLILISPTIDAKPHIKELCHEACEKGIHCELLPLHLDRRESLTKLKQHLNKNNLKISHIYHLAGQLADKLLANADLDDFNRVFRSKVNSALNLRDATIEHRPQFIFASSIVARVGNPGQIVYAGANSTLDRLASILRNEGLNAQSMGLCPISGNGMAQGQSSQLNRYGMLALKTQEAIAFLEQNLSANNPLLAKIDFSKLMRSPVLNLFESPQRPSDSAEHFHESKAATEQARPSWSGETKNLRFAVESKVKEIVSQILDCSIQDLSDNKSFVELGFDSMTSLELANNLSAWFKKPIPPTIVYEQSNLKDLIHWLAQSIPSQKMEETRAKDLPNQDIAIVGVGMRLPGKVSNLDQLGEVLAEGKDLRTPIPEKRFSLEKPEKDRLGYFIDCGESFDHGFFGINEKDAQQMDPQHRLLLETTWHALENAGILPNTLEGSSTGVFIGAGQSEYHSSRLDLPSEAYHLTGKLQSFHAGRIAYHFKLRGPTLSIDTACSSSLVALIQACRSLRNGESNIAIAGGVQLIADPKAWLSLEAAGALSPSSRSQTFSENADGYGRGEGVGVVILMPLEKAIQQNRNIHGVIKGGAINHDGASNGITAPSGVAQEALIAQALTDARQNPTDISYVECHGTGTKLGDPIEIRSLHKVYGAGRTEKTKLVLASCKSTLGHLESAAGIAGLMSVLASMQRKKLPISHHAKPLNKLLPWDQMPLEVLEKSQSWQVDAKTAVGISSFGLSGTNAHVIVGAPPLLKKKPNKKNQNLAYPLIFPISAADSNGIKRQAQSLLPYLLGLKDESKALSTAMQHKKSFENRAAIVASSFESLKESLQELGNGKKLQQIFHGQAEPRKKIAFVFPGQGSQWAQMGAKLYEQNAVFQEIIHQCEPVIAQNLGWSIKQLLKASTHEFEKQLSLVTGVQPALFAIQLGIAHIWESLNIKADGVIGHSQGEICAAVFAGALTIEEGCHIVCQRSLLIKDHAPSGSMALIESNSEQVSKWIEEFGDRLSIAVSNSPSSTVVSGEEESIDALLIRLEALDVFCSKLAVDYASHSKQMESLRPHYNEYVQEALPKPARLDFYSSLYSKRIDSSDLTHSYWFENLRQPVLFSQSLVAMSKDNYDVLIECSPHPILKIPILTQMPESLYVGSLKRDHGEYQQLLSHMAELYCQGAIESTDLINAGKGFDPNFPAYPFNRKELWREHTAHSGALKAITTTSPDHPWLDSAAKLPSDCWLFAGQISLQKDRWLADHKVFNATVLPGTGSLDLFLSAAKHINNELSVEEVQWLSPIVLADNHPTHLTLEASKTKYGYAIKLFCSLPKGDGWELKATASLSSHRNQPLLPQIKAPADKGQVIELKDFYPNLQDKGLDYGESFALLLSAARLSDHLIKSEIQAGASALPTSQSISPPHILDAAMHAALAFASHHLNSERGIYLPSLLEGLSIPEKIPQDQNLTVLIHKKASEKGSLSIGLDLFDANGVAIASIKSMRLTLGQNEDLFPATLNQPHIYKYDLQPVLLAKDKPFPEAAWGSESQSFALLPQWKKRFTQIKDCDLWVLDLRNETLMPANQQEWYQQIESATFKLQAALKKFAVQENCAKLFVITGSALSNPEQPACVLQQALRAMVRSFAHENPEKWIRTLEIRGKLHDLHDLLASSVLDTTKELVYTQGQWHTPHLKMIEARQKGKAKAIQCVLITGGTGELGSALAEELLKKHAVKHLILLSRSASEEKHAALKKHLLSQGASSVELVSGDCADQEVLESLLKAQKNRPVVDSVFHLAGSLEDGLLTEQTEAKMQRVLASKLKGALVLGSLSQRHQLKSLVFFSSAAGVLGTQGQSVYALANSFLDAYAMQLAQSGIHAKSISWGLWQPDGSGMTNKLKKNHIHLLKVNHGILPLKTEEGMELFTKCLNHSKPWLVAGKFDSFIAKKMPLFNLKATAQAARKNAGSSATKGPQWLEGCVEACFKEVLGLDPEQSIPAKKNWKSLGVDSMIAVQIRNQLTQKTGLKLPATLVFDYPNKETLLAYLKSLNSQKSPKIERSEQPAKEAVSGVAIVGLGCRLPQGIDSPESFWDALDQGMDGIGPLPKRWKELNLYDSDPEAIGKSYCNAGGFLNGYDEFDHSFFGISKTEAKSMDPQQRHLLEVSWNALEDAGIPPFALNSSQTGVFLGSMGSDYAYEIRDSLSQLDGFQSLGQAASVMSGRISYYLGLQGPSMTVDTACSSSAVAIHLACQSILSKETNLAIAGGVTIMNSPNLFVEFSRLGGMAKDGRCKSFSDKADGAGWGEAVGAIVLKSLDQAIEDGDRIYGVVKGSAVNQDGKTHGISSPNGPSQVRVIQTALKNAGLSVNDIDVIEAHGTGTTLGDPIEANALAEVFANREQNKPPVYLGSVKSNFGHTQAAAGVIGVIKILGAMQRNHIPPTLHAEGKSKHVDWSNTCLSLVVKGKEWLQKDKPRRGGVSSFGISGTNAHIILEEFKAPQPPKTNLESEEILPFVLSSVDNEGLKRQANKLEQLKPTFNLQTLVKNSWSGKSHHSVRLGVQASSIDELKSHLKAYTNSNTPEELVIQSVHESPKLAFVFPGQGSQWKQMGSYCYKHFSIYRQTVDRCALIFSAIFDWSLIDYLNSAEGVDLLKTEWIQPALFSVQVALAEFWKAQGLKPQILIGHSQGEVAAAVFGGALTLEEGAKIVAERALCIAKFAPQGAMMSVSASEKTIKNLLNSWQIDRVEIAVANGPEAIVLSGEAKTLQKLKEKLDQQNIFCRILRVNYGSHSSHIEPLLPALSEALSEVKPRKLDIPMISTVTGEIIDGVDLTKEYWIANLRKKVLFKDALQAAMAQGINAFVESSPHPILSHHINDQYPHALQVSSLHKKRTEKSALMHSLAKLYTWGVLHKIADLKPDMQAKALTYEFAKTTIPGPKRSHKTNSPAINEHPFIQEIISLAGSNSKLVKLSINSQENPWLFDHKVFGTPVLPGTVLLDALVYLTAKLKLSAIKELVYLSPIPIMDHLDFQIQIDGQDFKVFLFQKEWQLCAEGCFALVNQSSQTSWNASGLTAHPLDREPFYKKANSVGLGYSKSFQGLSHLTIDHDKGVALGKASLPKACGTGQFYFHPALLDTILHSILNFIKEWLKDEALFVPAVWRHVQQTQKVSGQTYFRVIKRQTSEAGHLVCEVNIQDENQSIFAGELELRRLAKSKLGFTSPLDGPRLFSSRWVPILQTQHSDRQFLIRPLPLDQRLYAGLATDPRNLCPDLGNANLGDHQQSLVIKSLKVNGKETSAILQQCLKDLHCDLMKHTSNEENKVQDFVLLLSEERSTEGSPWPLSAALAGFMQSAQREFAHFKFKCVILQGGPTAQLGQAMQANAPICMLRNDSVLVEQLVEAEEKTPPTESKQLKTIVVAGGTGVVGCSLVESLAQMHPEAQIFVLARKKTDSDHWKSRKNIAYIQADVSSLDSMRGAFSSHNIASIDLFINAAGALKDSLFTQIDFSDFIPMAIPKIIAMEKIRAISNETPIHRIVHCSSAAGILGSSGQAIYSAINRFLDAAVQNQTATSGIEQSIAWGLWAPQNSGMTSHIDSRLIKRMRQYAMSAMNIRDGQKLFLKTLSTREPFVMAAHFCYEDLDSPQKAIVAGESIYQNLLKAANLPSEEVQNRSWFFSESNLDQADWQIALKNKIRGITSSALGRKASEIPEDKNLKNFGLDSLIAVEIKSRLAKEFALRFPSALLFNYPTINALFEYIGSLLNPDSSDEITETKRHLNAELDSLLADLNIDGGQQDSFDSDNLQDAEQSLQTNNISIDELLLDIE